MFFLKLLLTIAVFLYPVYRGVKFRRKTWDSLDYFKLTEDKLAKSFRIFTYLIIGWVLYLVVTSDNSFDELINPLLLLGIGLGLESFLRGPRGIRIDKEGIVVYNFLNSYFPIGRSGIETTGRELTLSVEKEGKREYVKLLEKDFQSKEDYKKCIHSIKTVLQES